MRQHDRLGRTVAETRPATRARGGGRAGGRGADGKAGRERSRSRACPSIPKRAFGCGGRKQDERVCGGGEGSAPGGESGARGEQAATVVSLPGKNACYLNAPPKRLVVSPIGESHAISTNGPMCSESGPSQVTRTHALRQSTPAIIAVNVFGIASIAILVESLWHGTPVWQPVQ